MSNSTFTRYRQLGKKSLVAYGMRLIFTCVLIFLVPISFVLAGVAPTLAQKTAQLRVLDKITARVQEINVPCGSSVTFGSLTVTVEQCLITPPEDPPEAAAVLAITDQRPGDDRAVIFHGWMFASSPALSALEHPVYDVWVTRCF